jgi:two-component system chemotaxis response regulator CheB
MDNKIKVLIVDDALFMRKAISEVLESDNQLKVIGTARDGIEGLEQIKKLKPDVITLDIDMPRMDGLEAIRHIMIESPVPVVVLSSLFSDGAVTFEALRLGVVDFVPKPSGTIVEDVEKSRKQIIDRIKIASCVNFDNIRRVKLDSKKKKEGLSVGYGFHPLEHIIAIGTTLSGPNTVIRLLSKLSPTIPAAILVLQEIAPQILQSFINEFDKNVPWKICIAKDKEIIEQGTCYICSNEQTMTILENENRQPYINITEKTKDPLNTLFSSSAKVFNKNTIGVMLTGIGDDGAEGFHEILNHKGITLAQDASCCVYPNLINNAIQKGSVIKIVNEKQLPNAIEESMILQ